MQITRAILHFSTIHGELPQDMLLKFVSEAIKTEGMLLLSSLVEKCLGTDHMGISQERNIQKNSIPWRTRENTICSGIEPSEHAKRLEQKHCILPSKKRKAKYKIKKILNETL